MATRNINSFIQHLMTEKVTTAGAKGGRGSSTTGGMGGGYRSGSSGTRGIRDLVRKYGGADFDEWDPDMTIPQRFFSQRNPDDPTGPNPDGVLLWYDELGRGGKGPDPYKPTGEPGGPDPDESPNPVPGKPPRRQPQPGPGRLPPPAQRPGESNFRSGEGGGQDGGRGRSLRRDFFAPKLNPTAFPDQPGDDATDPSEVRPRPDTPTFIPPMHLPTRYPQSLIDAFRKYF